MTRILKSIQIISSHPESRPILQIQSLSEAYPRFTENHFWLRISQWATVANSDTQHPVELVIDGQGFRMTYADQEKVAEVMLAWARFQSIEGYSVKGDWLA